MRTLILALVLVTGCTPGASPPSYLHAISVASGVAAVEDSPMPEPTPSDECESCGGQGWLGDGTIKKDCPDCDTPWQQVGIAPAEVQQLLDAIQQLQQRIEQLEQRVAEIQPCTCEKTEAGKPPSPGAAAVEDAMDSAAPPSAAPGFNTEIEWVTTAEARASGKPVWIHFTGSRCGPCRAQERTVLVNESVIDMSREWSCVKIVDVHPWMQHYGVNVWPSDVFVTDDGNSIHENTSAATAADFVNFLGEGL